MASLEPVFATRLEKVVVPIWASSGSRPAAMIFLESVSSGFQRKLFFRIGALPEVTSKGVRIQINRRECAEEVFGKIQETLKSFGGTSPLTIRNLVLEVDGETKPRLKAVEARLVDRGFWRLSQLEIAAGGLEISASEGELLLSRNQACTVRLKTGVQDVIYDIFKSKGSL